MTDVSLLRRRLAFSICLFAYSVVAGVHAELPTTPVLLSANPRFEQAGGDVGSLEGWQQHGSWGIGPSAEAVVYDVGLRSRFDDLLGNYQMRLRGQGGIGQVIEIPADVENLLMNAMAYFRKIDLSSEESAIEPTLRVTYYNAQWQEIDQRTLQVGSFSGRGSRGLNNYTLGLEVSEQARYALMAVYNFDPSVEVFVGRFALYDATDRTPPGGLRNLAFNTPLVETISQDTQGNPYFLLGDEFWYSNIELTDHRDGVRNWGSVNKADWAWQPVDVVENRLYQITIKADLINSDTTPVVGLDFYGEQDGRVFLLQRRLFDVVDQTTPAFVPELNKIFVAPAGTAYTTAHFLAPKMTDTPPTNQFATYGTGAPEIVILDIGSAPSSASETTTYYTDLADTGSGWALQLWFRDQDGIDENSLVVLGENPTRRGPLPDVVFTSRSDPTREYQAFLETITRQPTFTIQDDGREVGINILVFSEDPSDLGGLVLREGAIRDRLGNPSPRIEYEPFALP